MKLRLFTIGLVLFQIATLNLTAQIVFTKNDTISLTQDSLILKVGNHYGNVLWQYSKESENWFDLQGQTNDSLLFLSIDSSGYYRAKIVDGTCEPTYSDTTYILRALTDSMVQVILNQTGETANDIAFLSMDNENSVFTVLDTTSINPKIQIVTTELPDTIQPGWLIVDTTGVGRVILVTNYTIKKIGNDFITKIINGVQVGIDFLITDQELSYSSPSNRTKQEWNSPLKLSNTGKFKDNISYTLEDGSQSVTVKNSTDLLSLNFSKKELWNFETGTSNMRFWLESGSISIKPALDFYAKYVPTVVATKLLYSVFFDSPFLNLPDYSTKGSLNDLKLITYTDFDINLKFKIEASVHEDISDFIKPVKIIEYFYSIPAGPVFVTVKTELFARLIFEATGEISVNPELEWNNNIVLGIEGHKIGNQFERDFIKSYSDKKSATTSVEGNFNLRERIEIVPRIEVYIMGLTGLKIETIPFQEFTFNASFSDKDPLLYDYSFDLGIDAQAAFDISAFHWDNLTLAIFKKNLEILTKKNILSAPYNLEYVSGNNQSGYPGQFLTDPLSARVVDSRGKILNNYPIFYDVISGGGSMQSSYLKSDNAGITNNNWKLGDLGVQSSRAYLKKANHSIINRSILDFNATLNSTGLPTVTTTTITDINQTTAIGGGNVTADGGATVTARGVCWNINPNPTIDNSKTSNGEGIGSFISSITDLAANTQYYVRAYATNSQGTAYGNEVTFTTTAVDGPVYGSFTDPRDGHVYKTVTIGEQVWMAENLAYLPSVSPPTSKSNTQPIYYVYDYNGTDVEVAKAAQNYNKYGVLYNWTAANTSCPNGWHLPSDNEWEQLAIFISNQNGGYVKSIDDWNNVGKHLKATNGWNNNGNGTDDYGFSGVPAGSRYYGYFTGIGNREEWWSSKESSVNNAWARGVDYGNPAFYNYPSYAKERGYSVRCIKD